MTPPPDSASAPKPSPSSSTDADSRRQLRWSVYWLLIFLSAGTMTGRILAVNSVDVIALQEHLFRHKDPEWYRERPFLSSNDRSRWATIRALVENGSYVIDDIIQEPGWDTIDMVKHDGHLYSSKPPLLPTMLAGEYWLIHKLTGMKLATHPHAVGRIMLILTNVIPLAIAFFVLARLVERFGTTDWGRIFVMAAATFGTFLTTFAVTLNNHCVAAVSVVYALSAAVPIWFDGNRAWWRFGLAGLFAAFVAANELPGLSFFGLLGVALLCKDAPRTLAFGLPAALVVVAAFFATNWAAHGSLKPPYAHRSEGDNWYKYTYTRDGRTIESYWQDRQGIDQGEPSRATYALHVLVGHHGILSLTPVWVLSFLAMLYLPFQREHSLRGFAAFTLILTVVCLAFYLSRPQLDRNYGGMTSGFRWMFWFAPMWLLVMLPVADFWAKRRSLRILAYCMLALSALSAFYPTWNPWSHPWIYQLMQHEGWLPQP